MIERENSKNTAGNEKSEYVEHAKTDEEAFQEFVERELNDEMQTVPKIALCYLFLNDEPIKNRVKIEYLEYYFMVKDLVKFEKDFTYQTKTKAAWVENLNYKFCTNN